MKSIFWRQGLFLTPQHLQQQDAYAAWQPKALWRISQRYGWGVNVLEVRADYDPALRADLIRTGIFELVRCELVTKDGQIILAGSSQAGANALVAPRSFRDLIDPTGAVGVYIGIPRYNPSYENLADFKPDASAMNPPARFSVFQHGERDLFDDSAGDTDVAYLQFNLTILFSNEPNFNFAADAFELVKIAEIHAVTNIEGAVRINREYIAPCLSVKSSPALHEKLKSLRDLLLGKAEEFAAFKRQRGIRATTSGNQDTLRVVMLQTLNRTAASLHHQLESGVAHPEVLYQDLRCLVADFSAFSEEYSALGRQLLNSQDGGDLPPYQHEDLRLCFSRAVQVAQDLIRSLTAGPEAGITLVFDGVFGEYRASLPQEVLISERARFYLMIDSLVGGDQIAALLQQTGKICTAELMPQIRKGAVRGLKVTYIPVAPEELPQRGGNHHYFGIDTNNEYWARIRDAGNIAIFCGLKPDQTVIKLVYVKSD